MHVTMLDAKKNATKKKTAEKRKQNTEIVGVLSDGLSLSETLTTVPLYENEIDSSRDLSTCHMSHEEPSVKFSPSNEIHTFRNIFA